MTQINRSVSVLHLFSGLLDISFLKTPGLELTVSRQLKAFPVIQQWCPGHGNTCHVWLCMD